jgi:hypothetical protein
MTRVRTCLRLYPTMIEYCQARLARETEAQSIAKKMQKLCTPFGTLTRWDEEQRRLEVSAKIADMDSSRR